MATGKTIALTRWTFVGKVMSLLFNKLSRLVIAFLPRSKYLNFMTAVTICSDLGAQENKVCPCLIPFYFFFFLIDINCLITLCFFQVYSKMIHICIYMDLDSLLLEFTTVLQIEYSFLCSRSLLVIFAIYDICMCIYFNPNF